MSFQFQIEAPATDFSGVEILPKARKKNASGLPLLLLDQWRCDIHNTAIKHEKFDEFDFYFDYSEYSDYKKGKKERKGRYYEELSQALPNTHKIRRAMAVGLFRFFCPNNQFVKYAFLHARYSTSRGLDLQELAFYEHIADQIDHLMNFIFESSLVIGIFLCLVGAWNHGIIQEILNIENGVIVPLQ